jgi:hypothetical protein
MTTTEINKQTLEITDSCTLSASKYTKNGKEYVELYYYNETGLPWIVDNHTLDSAKIREIIDFLEPFAEPSIAISTPSDSFSIRMSEELAREFDEIQKDTGMNGAEVFRRAIALYKIAKKASTDGEQVILRAKDNERIITHI